MEVDVVSPVVGGDEPKARQEIDDSARHLNFRAGVVDSGSMAVAIVPIAPLDEEWVGSCILRPYPTADALFWRWPVFADTSLVLLVPDSGPVKRLFNGVAEHNDVLCDIAKKISANPMTDRQERMRAL